MGAALPELHHRWAVGEDWVEVVAGDSSAGEAIVVAPGHNRAVEQDDEVVGHILVLLEEAGHIQASRQRDGRTRAGHTLSVVTLQRSWGKVEASLCSAGALYATSSGSQGEIVGQTWWSR